jgi:serine/threonine protein kinase
MAAMMAHYRDDSAVAVRWTAPEAFGSGRYTRKTDVWSFGITMYEIWTSGALPYGRKWCRAC